jgi:very-short-patch-repair endonuclease
MNVMVRGFEVDALWERERLIVEIDGFAFHSSPTAFERDRRRDGILAAAGFRVLRVTWRQLTRETDSLLVCLAQALVTRNIP